MYASAFTCSVYFLVSVDVMLSFIKHVLYCAESELKCSSLERAVGMVQCQTAVPICLVAEFRVAQVLLKTKSTNHHT